MGTLLPQKSDFCIAFGSCCLIFRVVLKEELHCRTEHERERERVRERR